jgi:hypothetical protein
MVYTVFTNKLKGVITIIILKDSEGAFWKRYSKAIANSILKF